MPVSQWVRERLPQQFAPARARLAHAEAEEAQPVFRHDRARHREDSPRQQHGRDVGQEMAEHDPPSRDAGYLTALHVGHRALLQRFAAHQKRGADPPGEAQHRDHERDRRQRTPAAAQRGHQDQQQQKRREAHQYFHYPHHRQVEPAPPISGGDADRGADDERDRSRKYPDGERGARSVDQPGGDVASDRIAAEYMACAGRFVGPPDLLERRVGQRSEDLNASRGRFSVAVVRFVHARPDDEERQQEQRRQNGEKPFAGSLRAEGRQPEDRAEGQKQREKVETLLDEDFGVRRRRGEKVPEKRQFDPPVDDRQQRTAVGDERSEYGGQEQQRHPDDAETPRRGGEKSADSRIFLRHASPVLKLLRAPGARGSAEHRHKIVPEMENINLGTGGGSLKTPHRGDSRLEKGHKK